MSRPKVLLVEDDPSIAQFVQMALEELEIEFLACTNVADAWAALQVGDIRLVLTDLMLPGESGVELLHRLRRDTTGVPAVPVVVFSAGLTTPVRDELNALGVWRMLSKPTPVLELEACVRDALALPTQVPQPRTTLGAAPKPPAQHGTNLTAAESAAIATHFGGDERLFRAYRASCHAQFAVDVGHGNAALAAADWPALRRLAHSLKTVLLTLGHAEYSAVARALEDAASQPDPAHCAQGWGKLSAFLGTL